MQESIRPSPELVSRAVRSARPRRTVMLRRVLAAAAALALCICVPALAGPSVIYQLVYTVSPDFAQHFAPVQMACESNGVRLEVVSARIHGSTAEIYLTLQDLTGDRVDETTTFTTATPSTAPFPALRPVSAWGLIPKRAPPRSLFGLMSGAGRISRAVK